MASGGDERKRSTSECDRACAEPSFSESLAQSASVCADLPRHSHHYFDHFTSTTVPIFLAQAHLDPIPADIPILLQWQAPSLPLRRRLHQVQHKESRQLERRRRRSLQWMAHNHAWRYDIFSGLYTHLMQAI